jgi:hypothetical protein
VLQALKAAATEDSCDTLSSWQSANVCTYKASTAPHVWADRGTATLVVGVDLNRTDLGGTLSDDFLTCLVHLTFLHLNSLEHGEKTRQVESAGLREEEQSAVARRGGACFTGAWRGGALGLETVESKAAMAAAASP